MAFNQLIEIISGPEGGTATSVTNLYMSFEVERNKTNTPNKANVSIYNLSPNTMTKMESNKNKLIIRAGYDDETGLTTLFNGDVTKSERKKEGTEQVLEIEAMDGYKNIQSQNVSISYKSGTKTTTILRDILAAMAYPVAGGIPTSSDSYTGGFQYIGKAKDALTVVLKKIGYKWTIQNDQILIFKEIGGGSVVTGLLITPSTGLLSIEKLEQDTEEVKKTTYTNTKETEKKTTEKKKKRKYVSWMNCIISYHIILLCHIISFHCISYHK
jgi:hypothetical protein